MGVIAEESELEWDVIGIGKVKREWRVGIIPFYPKVDTFGLAGGSEGGRSIGPVGLYFTCLRNAIL